MSASSKTKKAFVFLGAGILLMIVGAFRGEITVVLQKAVVICLECVGIG